MVQIITIERKVLNIKIRNQYFVNKKVQQEPGVHLNGYSFSFVPGKSLRSHETSQIDLKRNGNELLMAMHRTTRSQIRSAEKEDFKHIVIKNPTDQDFMDFQTFYNHFAKDKKTSLCNSFHMKTMELLREKNGVMLTYMKDNQGNVLCTRVYITDGEFVMNLYSASHFRMLTSPELKRKMSWANRFLIWNNILLFKSTGHRIYDLGGLTEDENIRRFKLDFGGEVVPVYSGYEANSIIGAIILKMKGLKMALVSGG